MHEINVKIMLHGIQVVDEIFDRHAAARMGIDKVTDSPNYCNVWNLSLWGPKI